MTDLMQEIDDDLRREKFEQLWKKHGRALMAVVALAVVLTGAWVFWQKEQAASQAASTATLVQSLKKIGGSTAGDAVATLEKLAAEKRGKVRTSAPPWNSCRKARATQACGRKRTQPPQAASHDGRAEMQRVLRGRGNGRGGLALGGEPA